MPCLSVWLLTHLHIIIISIRTGAVRGAGRSIRLQGRHLRACPCSELHSWLCQGRTWLYNNKIRHISIWKMRRFNFKVASNPRNLPDGFRTQVPGNFRVMRAAKLTEWGDSILLPYLKRDNGPSWQILNNGQILRQDALVNIIELFDDRAGQVEEFHGWDLKTGLQDHINHFACVAFALNVGFDETECAVVKDGRCLHRARCWVLTSEPEVVLALVWTKTVRSVHSILGAISTMYRAQGLGRFSPSYLCVGWANHCAPCLHGTLTNELHTNDYIALDKRL